MSLSVISFTWFYRVRGWGSGGRRAVGGFSCRAPAHLVFNQSMISKLPRIVHPFKHHVLLACNNKDVGHVNLCSHIGRLLGSFRVFRLNNVRPGPGCSADMIRNMHVYGRRRVSIVLSINNNSMLSYSGTVTKNTGCSNRA